MTMPDSGWVAHGRAVWATAAGKVLVVAAFILMVLFLIGWFVSWDNGKYGNLNWWASLTSWSHFSLVLLLGFILLVAIAFILAIMILNYREPPSSSSRTESKSESANRWTSISRIWWAVVFGSWGIVAVLHVGTSTKQITFPSDGLAVVGFYSLSALIIASLMVVASVRSLQKGRTTSSSPPSQQQVAENLAFITAAKAVLDRLDKCNLGAYPPSIGSLLLEIRQHKAVIGLQDSNSCVKQIIRLLGDRIDMRTLMLNQVRPTIDGLKATGLQNKASEGICIVIDSNARECRRLKAELEDLLKTIDAHMLASDSSWKSLAPRIKELDKKLEEVSRKLADFRDATPKEHQKLISLI